MITAIHQSHLGMFLRCPQQFERRYILGEIIPPGIAARRGSATHKAAEINHLQKLNSGEDLPVTDLQDAARDEYVRLVKDEGVFIPKDMVSEKGRLLAEGQDAATRLTKVYREDLAPLIQPALVEEKLTIDVGLVLPIQGTIDVLTVDNWLPDLKTADKSKSAGEADNSLQLSFYSGMVAHHTGKWPEKISLEILVDNKTPKRQSLETKRGPKDFANLLLRLQMFIAQLETGLFPPCDPGAWVCSQNWCGYFWTCKYTAKTGTRYNRRPKLMHTLCRRAGIPYFGFHAIRHYVASFLHDSKKVSLPQVSKLLRHQSKATTERYLQVIDPGSRAAMEALEGDFVSLNLTGRE